MKNILFFIIMSCSIFCNAQVQDRVMIEGKINVPAGDDPEGIAIFNISSNSGTVSTENGEFTIAVGVGDEISFSALQFQDFTVRVDQGIVESGQLTVTISEAITQLPEVVVTPYDLSGNVRVDVNRIEVEDPNLPDDAASEINPADWQFKPDEMTSPEVAAMDNPRLRYGLNIANIFRTIYSELTEEKADQRALDEKIRSLYEDEFFQEYLNIDQENINDFIFFAKDNGLTPQLLQEGNELDLIQFLITQSENYKKVQD